VAFVICLSVVLLLSFVAAVARSPAVEADDRRGEADLATAIARVLPRKDDLRSALPVASARLAQALGLWAAAIELGAAVGGERVACGERVVASVQELLCAAREREGIGSAVERCGAACAG
jgi:hypothetical protein